MSLGDNQICSFCKHDLERTNFENYTEPTPMDQLFWGRQTVKKTYAHFYFKKGTGIQRLLFSLKYGKNTRLGIYLGEEMGTSVKELLVRNNIDALVPVPLHPKRQFKRGYNQSLLLAKGIQNITSLPVNDSLVKRRTNNRTQTGKSRFERWENVSSIFEVDKRQLQKLNHIAIVDDVITTGSTIESLIEEFRAVSPDIRISVVTLALA